MHTFTQVCDSVEDQPGLWFCEEWRLLTTNCHSTVWPAVPPDTALKVWLVGESVDRFAAINVATSNISFYYQPFTTNCRNEINACHLESNIARDY